MSNTSKYSVERSNVSPSSLAGTREYFDSIEYLSPIVYKNASRYSKLRTIQDDDGKIYHETWFQKVIDKSSDDKYYTVTEDTENRLDVISNIYYNTPRYWWVVALANYIIDPFDVPMGTSLRIPPLVSLYNKGGVLGG
jgi:hypothetical protein